MIIWVENIYLFMRRFIMILELVLFTTLVSAQGEGTESTSSNTSLQRPKLVIGIVVDQMRWDYLYRYYDRYAPDGGFKRLLNGGFSCENTMIPYTPTITACGHASIYTGSVPAINGITGNDWFDYNKGGLLYCTQDDGEKTTGSNTAEAGQMSPRNLLVTTITDELRLATNFRGKVIGLAIKDRSAILPAGHSANAAYWYDHDTGKWITSTYYKDELPGWVKDFNSQKLADKYYALDWNTMYPLDSYTQSAPPARAFPHNLKQYTGKNYQVISATPYGNSFTIEMAKAAIAGEQLGADSITDMLTISLSSPDYIGHAYGPNSVEEEDCFLRLDKDLGEILDLLDKQIGKGAYMIFLTADHGVANVPAFLNEHKIPAGNFDNEQVTAGLNQLLNNKFKAEDLVTGILNYQVYLNRNAIAENKINKDLLYATVINYLLTDTSVERAFALDAIYQTTINATIKEAFINGYYPSRSGDIQIILKPQYIDGFVKGGTTHGVWNPYDAHIPLIWFGWNISPGKTNKEVYITDIAPTVAALLKIQMPSGCIGHVIEGVVK